jgi:hypothetical protein
MPVGMPRVPAANAGSRALARGARQQQCWMPRSLMTSEENSGEIPPTGSPADDAGRTKCGLCRQRKRKSGISRVNFRVDDRAKNE